MKRSGPMKRGAPMKRTQMKRKAKPAAPAVEKQHMHRVAEMPCLVCGSPATVHHVTASIHGGRITRSNWLVVPLCPIHHQIQHGPHESVEALGHRGFYEAYGINLLEVAERLSGENKL